MSFEVTARACKIPEDAAEGVLIGYSKHDHTPPVMPVKVNALCHLCSSAGFRILQVLTSQATFCLPVRHKEHCRGIAGP